MTTIHPRFWGNRAGVQLPLRVTLRDQFDSPMEAIGRYVARNNGGIVIANARHDGWSLDKCGEKDASHYQMTFGRRLRTGGYSVEGEAWCAIPLRAEAEG